MSFCSVLANMSKKECRFYYYRLDETAEIALAWLIFNKMNNKGWKPFETGVHAVKIEEQATR